LCAQPGIEAAIAYETGMVPQDHCQRKWNSIEANTGHPR
jgi:hypothetical protein